MTEIPKTEKRPELNDTDLIRRAQMEDLHAYEQLVRRQYGLVYSLAYGMTSNRDDAEHITREVFVKAWKAIGHLPEQADFPSWMGRIAFQRTFKFCKKHKKLNPDFFEDFDPAIKKSDPYKKLSSKGAVLRKMRLKEFQRELNGILGSLTRRQRATLILHDLHGLSPLEVAKVMSGTEGPARSRLHQAHKKIQKHFGDTELDAAGLVKLKAYARPAGARVEKNIDQTLHAVRSSHKRPSLHHFPDKSLAWMFAQPRYGVAALFILFLGLHLLERPLPKAVAGSGTIDKLRTEMSTVVDTNAVPAQGIPVDEPIFPALIEPPPFK